jgi:predicted regulator of Ras-like GTPase activity (Roadblock/LC7/MglB family)
MNKPHKTPYAELLAMLSRHRGVVGSFVVSEADGLAIDSNVQIGVHAEAVAALAASLHRKTRLACGAAGCGAVTFLRLDAERGGICAAGRDDLVLVTISEARANIGLLRVEMMRAAKALT